MTGAPSPWGTGYTQFCGADRERGPTYGKSLPISCELVPHSWTSVLGRVSFGLRIGATLGGNGCATLKPVTKINGIWDFEREDTVTTTGALLKTGENALNLGGGVDVTLVNGMALRIAGDWFTYDTELQGWSISGGIGGSFAAFGLTGVAPGFVSLDLSSNGEEASATARIRIPLGGAQ